MRQGLRARRPETSNKVDTKRPGHLPRPFCYHGINLSVYNVQLCLERILQNSRKVNTGLLGSMIKPRGDGAIFADGAHVVFATILGKININ